MFSQVFVILLFLLDMQSSVPSGSAPPHYKLHPHVREQLIDKQLHGTSPGAAYRQCLLESAESSPEFQPRNKKQAYNVAEHLKRKYASRDDLFEIYKFSNRNPGCVLTCDISDCLDIAMSHPALLEHLNEMHKIEHIQNGSICYHYDTTYKIGKCFASILSFRHTYFLECPIVPIVVLIHTFTDANFHRRMLRLLKGFIPGLNSQNTVIISDRESSIKVAIEAELPLSKCFYCWNHMKRNVHDWTMRRYGEQKSSGYTRDVALLLRSNSIEHYKKRLNRFQKYWDIQFCMYFSKHLEDDLLKSTKWNLEDVGIYTDSSGITNNSAESANAMLKSLLSFKHACLYQIVTTVHLLQASFLLEVKRGIDGIGEYKLSVNYANKYTLLPSITYGKEKAEPKSNAEKTLSKSARSLDIPAKYTTGLADYYIADKKIHFYLPAKIFIVNGLGGKRQVVNLKDNSCTCYRRGLCSHLLAVLVLTGMDHFQTLDILTRRRRFMGFIYRKSAPSSAGKKPGTRFYK